MCCTCQSSFPLTGATVFKVYEEPAEEIVPEEPPEEVVEEPEPAPPPKGTWQARWSVHCLYPPGPHSAGLAGWPVFCLSLLLLKQKLSYL